MYIPDLRNLSTEPGVEVMAVGWLDVDAPFQQSAHVDQALLERAKRWIDATLGRDLAVIRTRGFHRCNLCRDRSCGSNASVLVPTRARSTFFLTNLLLPHYIEAHFYSPPQTFIKALSEDHSVWEGPTKSLERNIVVSSREGDEIERKQLLALAEKYPELKDDILRDLE